MRFSVSGVQQGRKGLELSEVTDQEPRCGCGCGCEIELRLERGVLAACCLLACLLACRKCRQWHKRPSFLAGYLADA